jgi:hypothetical protein
MEWIVMVLVNEGGRGRNGKGEIGEQEENRGRLEGRKEGRQRRRRDPNYLNVVTSTQESEARASTRVTVA